MIQSNDRVFLAGMNPSTPAARVPRWRTCLRGAWIIQINGKVVSSIQEVYEAVKAAKDEGHGQL